MLALFPRQIESPIEKFFFFASILKSFPTLRFLLAVSVFLVLKYLTLLKLISVLSEKWGHNFTVLHADILFP